MQGFQLDGPEIDRTRERFVRRNTAVQAVPFCPEIRIRTHGSMTDLWEALDGGQVDATGQPPYWCVPWVGGQALARYVLDNASAFAGRRVLDVGSGSGLCAIAAARSGAAAVVANDIDPLSLSAIRLNADLNGVVVSRCGDDMSERDTPDCDVILAADMWYERSLARRLTRWLRGLAAGGRLVLLGDMSRAHFSRSGLAHLARYEIPTSEEIEQRAVTTAHVWRMLPADA